MNDTSQTTLIWEVGPCMCLGQSRLGVWQRGKDATDKDHFDHMEGDKGLEIAFENVEATRQFGNKRGMFYL